jgi:predicted DNA-binding transcriptional regulator AlpA
MMKPNAVHESSYRDEDLLTAAEVAAILKMSKATLDGWRCKRIGPKFRKMGRRIVRYLGADVRRFVEGQGNP